MYSLTVTTSLGIQLFVCLASVFYCIPKNNSIYKALTICNIKIDCARLKIVTQNFVTASWLYGLRFQFVPERQQRSGFHFFKWQYIRFVLAFEYYTQLTLRVFNVNTCNLIVLSKNLCWAAITLDITVKDTRVDIVLWIIELFISSSWGYQSFFQFSKTNEISNILLCYPCGFSINFPSSSFT